MVMEKLLERGQRSLLQNKTIIESIRDFILTCSFLQEWKVNIDHLDLEMSYSIDPLPANPVVKTYTDGSCVKQFLFAFTSKEEYDGDARTGIENSGFYQKFEEWLERKNLKKEFPILENAKQIPISIYTIQSGYLYDSETDKAQYQIQCALQYEQEV